MGPAHAALSRWSITSKLGTVLPPWRMPWGPRQAGPRLPLTTLTASLSLQFCRGPWPDPQLKRYVLRFTRDGRVEGCALTPSCESTGITTNCWTIIDRKTLELTKKDTPHPKTKEKPQWDGRRGAITIKSNPTTAGWVTHKLENAYTTEVHPKEWRFWASRQASQPGDLATGGGIPRESDFEG